MSMAVHVDVWHEGDYWRAVVPGLRGTRGLARTRGDLEEALRETIGSHLHLPGGYEDELVWHERRLAQARDGETPRA